MTISPFGGGHVARPWLCAHGPRLMMFGFDLGPADGCAALEQKMERERQEKLKKKLEQEKADADKTKPADSDKVPYLHRFCMCRALGDTHRALSSVLRKLHC